MIWVKNDRVQARWTSASSEWDREYGSARVIPSSTRVSPSKALVLLSELLRFEQVQSVLDAGCGNGRNSIYLARKGCFVTAVDFSARAIRLTRDLALATSMQDLISIRELSLDRPFPMQSDCFDLSLDSYVSCHFLNDEAFEQFHREFRRVTKPGGYVFTSAFAVDDGYYASFAAHRSTSHGPVVVDPHNGIAKQIYTEASFRSAHERFLPVLYSLTFRFSDIVLGAQYLRSILVLVLQKPSSC